MDIIIRPARTADTGAIADLWMAMMREHRGFEPRLRLSHRARESYEAYAVRYCDQPDSIIRVACHRGAGESGERVIGFSLAYRVRNLPMFDPPYYGFISDVTVARGHRGAGLGRRLVEETIEAFAAMGLGIAQLQVYAANEAGLRFWRRMGFEPYVHALWKALDA